MHVTPFVYYMSAIHASSSLLSMVMFEIIVVVVRAYSRMNKELLFGKGVREVFFDPKIELHQGECLYVC